MTASLSPPLRDPEVLRNVRKMLDTICDRWNAVNRRGPPLPVRKTPIVVGPIKR